MENYDMEYDSDYYHGNDIFKSEESSEVSPEIFRSPIVTKPGAQMTVHSAIPSEKEKAYSPRKKKKYNRKEPSFTSEYFEKKVNNEGEEVRACKIINENGIKCNREYKNVGSSTGNLITHLRDCHGIVAKDGVGVLKNSQDSKITDFVRKVRPHPKHIQKRREEAILKWMLLTNQPLSTVTNNAYKEKMAEFDPAFSMPGEKKIKTMIVKSYKFNQENLQNLLTQTTESISLTMDFWSSRAKHSYLGITATWITPSFEVKDVMLENKYVPSPHSSRVVADELYRCIKVWNLEHRIASITTDNGSNMIATFPLLNQKEGCDNIKRLSCTAHTLQLVIGKGLALAEILVARARRLVQFFQSPKQIERLDNVQKKLGYTDVVHCIQDVSTRWNSSYYSWDRLFFLKDAITQLQTDLYTSVDREVKKDGSKLKKINLSDDEWELLDKLIDLLMPFEEATREFSGNTYVTLSKVIPTIKEMIYDLASEAPSDNNLFSDEDTVFELEAEEMQPIDLDDDEIISNITKQRISIKNPLDTTDILDKVKQNIYDALIYYWNDPNELGLMATLLDPRYKSLDFLGDDSEKQHTIQKLRDEISKVEDPVPDISINSTPSNEESSTRSHKVYLQQRQMKRKKKDKVIQNPQDIDEISNYLSLPLILKTEDPLHWWKMHSKNFPKLTKIARKFLAIPATSVSSERLFSDAGNLINSKRVNLDLTLVGQILFLKRNLGKMPVFAPEWNEEETDHVNMS